MQITIKTESYNERRYGKPWIAKVDFTSNKKGDFLWGEWIGDGANGGSGTIHLDVELGDIVARGQKDFRKPKNSAPDFYVVLPGGALEYLGDRGAAYQHYLKSTPNPDDLRAEKTRLIARIAEIDAILND